jgi:tRNA dimethylallyltransferase
MSFGRAQEASYVTKASRAKRRVVVALVGPTASGKSALSIELAKAFDGEIVSCDALQVYRHLDIGTGKMPVPDRKGIAHHLIDLVEPDREFSAADYIRAAAPVIRDIEQRSKLPMVVGGTGLYLRSLRNGLFEDPGRRPALRSRLTRIAERRGNGVLHRILEKRDPASAARVHPNDRVRLIRSLEVNLTSSENMSDRMRKRRSPLEGYRFMVVGLSPAREELVGRIEKRVRQMFDSGLVDEVRRASERFGPAPPAFKAIGYRETKAHLDGDLSLLEAERLTVRATVQYAKRQMTWFRREEGIIWFAGYGDDPEVVGAVREHLSSELGSLVSHGGCYDSKQDLVSVSMGANGFEE